MDITWLGYSCFRLKGKNTMVITDPYPPSIGYTIDKAAAGIVTVSHEHPDHSYVQAISGEHKVVHRAGEYEIAGVLIIGVTTYHDAENGNVLGKNTVFAIELDDVTVCHLGDLGAPLTSKQIEELGHVDILLVPVGGGQTISASQAAALVRSIEPKIVIPMHYKTPQLKKELETVDKFIKEMGLTAVVAQPKLTISKSNLPLTTQVMVLSCDKL
jgi:L-ascorbate metabolism protein UlaG (beta-lactamase superfamily)